MKLTIISDTHGQHEALGHLSGDVLIHCGDFENIFQQDKDIIEKLDDWFGRQNFDRILCVGGNHDHVLEQRQHGTPFKNAEFLHDRSYEFGGLKFHGSSWVPQLHNHAFYGKPSALKNAWANIPDDTDVLITHTPAAGILDVSSRGHQLGCKYLATRICDMNLKLHCFGHVHNAAGSKHVGETLFVNATSVNSNFEIAYQPFEFQVGPIR